MMATLWLTGTVVWLVLATWSIGRFRRLLRYARPASHDVRRLAQTMAQRLGLKDVPEIIQTPGAVSPLLWWMGGKAWLLVPRDLFGRLSEVEQATLLAHELAHLRRRDHWVRGLELVVTGLYWWHPVVWWARHELREAEEQCCDAWVLRVLPAAARDYANALLETVDFLSRSHLALPSAASGIGHVPLLRRRLTMIMRGTTPYALSKASLLAILGLAVLLPVRPTWAENLVSDDPSPSRQEGTAPKDLAEARRKVKESKAQVEAQKAQLDAAHAALQVAQKRLQAALDRLAALEKQGRRQELDLNRGTVRDRDRSSADRLADIEKKIDAVRQELATLRQQSTSRTHPSGRNPAVQDSAAGHAPILQELRAFGDRAVAVSSLAFSPDGKLVLSGSYDTTVRLWDASTGKELVNLKGHDSKVQSVAFAPDGRAVASGGYDGAVIIWDLKGFKERHRFEVGNGNKIVRVERPRIKSICFSPDGRLLLAGGEDGNVHIWDVESGSDVRQLTGRNAIQTIAISPDGKSVVAGGFDGTVQAFDLATGRVLFQITAHNGWVLRVAYSPDGKHILSAGEDRAIHIWDAATGKELQRLTGHGDKVECAAFSPDGRLILSGSFDNTIRLWDVQTSAALARLVAHGGPVLTVTFSPDGRWAVSGGDDGTIRLWLIAP
jgi:WD40 repeat protein/beta-lactamase regulating signal transducer with metallopeptidase domain